MNENDECLSDWFLKLKSGSIIIENLKKQLKRNKNFIDYLQENIQKVKIF